MQGWRTNMEDAHISEVKVTENVQVFGVFDGHGGKIQLLNLQVRKQLYMWKNILLMN